MQGARNGDTGITRNGGGVENADTFSAEGSDRGGGGQKWVAPVILQCLHVSTFEFFCNLELQVLQLAIRYVTCLTCVGSICKHVCFCFNLESLFSREEGKGRRRGRERLGKRGRERVRRCRERESEADCILRKRGGGEGGSQRHTQSEYRGEGGRVRRREKAKEGRE